MVSSIRYRADESSLSPGRVDQIIAETKLPAPSLRVPPRASDDIKPSTPSAPPTGHYLAPTAPFAPQ